MVDISFGEGISRAGDVLDLGVNDGIVERTGTWYSYKGDRLGQGRENAKLALKDNPELLKKLEAEIREKHGLKVKEPAPAAEKPKEKEKKK
mgnify:CR=1 FL=1